MDHVSLTITTIALCIISASQPGMSIGASFIICWAAAAGAADIWTTFTTNQIVGNVHPW